MIPEWLVPILFGFLLVACGLVLIHFHRRKWTSDQLQTGISSAERTFRQEQYQRRMKVAVILVGIGLFIPLGASVIPWARLQKPWQFYCFLGYWGSVILLSVYIAMLGMIDFYATITHGQSRPTNEKLKAIWEQELARKGEANQNEADENPSANSG